MLAVFLYPQTLRVKGNILNNYKITCTVQNYQINNLKPKNAVQNIVTTVTVANSHNYKNDPIQSETTLIIT